MEAILLGILCGLIAGLLPGIGVFVTLLLSYPLLLHANIIDILLFYISVASITQYIGSVSATVLGVPGENSSLPALYEGNTMFKKGKGSLAISGAAIGSLVGAFLVLLLLFIISPLLDITNYLLSTYTKTILITLTLLVIILSSKSKWYIAILLAVLGLTLGSIGCHDDTCFVPPFFQDNPDLQIGIPLLPILCGIFVFPQLLKTYEYNKDDSLQLGTKLTYHLKYYFKNFSSSLRGTCVGCFVGLLPASGQTLCSNLAYRWEMLIQKRKHTYQKGNYNSLVSAETANNASVLTGLVPLFAIGIPTGASEALLLDIAISKMFNFSQDFTFELFTTIFIPTLIFVNICGFVLAWPLAKYVSILNNLRQTYINLFCFILLLLINLYMGYLEWATNYYLVLFMISTVFGFLLRKQDTLPLIFAFIVSSHILSTFYTLPDLLYADLSLLFN